ncbi:hypothetical protein CUMW_016400, partial [Citrus unshiu]
YAVQVLFFLKKKALRRQTDREKALCPLCLGLSASLFGYHHHQYDHLIKLVTGTTWESRLGTFCANIQLQLSYLLPLFPNFKFENFPKTEN